ncbi:DNA-(apurinic or apyrimidinic site) lyase [Plutella xylostella]|uniref:Aminopeptidase n=1 Tax=Plutella xylostella TaxID=51655 RepID=A0ABQ7QSU3_PLUXY|nr:DNA-(apurinic or apyrimidinic site) lyase [Plutella xylostella]
MRLLICLTLLGLVCGNPVQLTDNSIALQNTYDNYVLPAESFPTFYDVQLFFDPEYEASFNGTVAIRVVPRIATQEIVLHAMEMEILSIIAYSDLPSDENENLFSSFTLATDDTHLLKIQFTRVLDALQPITVEISYSAQYAPNMFGVYVSRYVENGATVSLVTSQLQPTFARRAFPCYDEPALKAVFRTTIYAPPAYNVVETNMPLRTDSLKSDRPGFTKHEFQDTLVMSSYLLAYLVSKFDYISNENNPTYDKSMKVFSRPGTQNTAEFALDFGQKNMVELEKYTEFPYAFPKIDKVAVPDFAAGAMENWGLVIYREIALLVQEGVTTTSTLQGIGRIISHENTHQWFGNEVGPDSWTYTWLNEGFANFFESFATDLVLPEWRMMDQFVINMQNVFQSDAVLSVNPMTFEVLTPSQILGTFNSVAYQKSGSVIRMMQHFLTPEIFRKSLALYISRMSRKAAKPTDLFEAIQEVVDASDHSIRWRLSIIMNRWTQQGGFPVVTVRRSAPSAQSFVITQRRFLTDSTQESNTVWNVPLNWVLSTDVNFNDTRPMAWLPPQLAAEAVQVPGLQNAEWFIVNKQQTGYYRVNYDPENWRALAKVLNDTHEIIHLLNRAQLIDDSFNLARNGRIDYSLAFDLSQYLVQERDYIPWAAANAAFNYLNSVLSGSSVHPLFQEYLLFLTAPLYQRLGFNAATDEEHVTPFHRNIILNINCLHGNEDCVNTAETLLQNFRDNPTQTLNPDIQTTVFCSGLRGGDVDNFNFLWARYTATQDSSEQSILLNALGCTSNADRRDFLFSQVIASDSQVREQDRHSVLVSAINSGPDNMNAALDFVLENFANIQPNVQGLTGTTNILNAFARTLTTQEHANKIDEFSNKYANVFTAGEMASVAAIKENIAASITWNSQNAATVEAWLRKNFGTDGASTVSASITIIISAMVTIYNIL